MAYVMPNLSTSGGIEVAGAELARQIDFFWSGILFMIFMVIWGSGFFAQERRVGAGNAGMWAAISGLITSAAGFILFLYDGALSLVELGSLIILLIVTIISTAAFIISQRS